MSHPYKFSEKAVRTKDGITIFTIKVRKIPNNISILDIREYFEKFGEVVKVWLPADRDRTIIYNWSDYRIQYADAKTAAAVLREPSHFIKRWRYPVEACSSVEQPDGQKILRQLSEMDFNDMQDNEAPITALNDDCLEHVFKFLAPLDQINMTLSCRRFASILGLHAKLQYKNVDYKLFRGMSAFQVCIFLQLVGPKIKIFTADFNLSQKNVSFFSTFLNNVEKFTALEIPEMKLYTMMKRMESLQELVLDRCNSLRYIYSGYLSKFKYLKKLKVIRASQLSGNGIHNLTGLDEIAFTDSTDISPYFKWFCRAVTGLRYLDVRCAVACRHMDTKDYAHIAKYLLRLETLKITCVKGNYNCLAQLPNLVKLAIDFAGVAAAEEFFAHLAEQKASQLQELSINSRNVTPMIVTSVSQLGKLRVLRCYFQENGDIMKEFANLKELEEIEFCKWLKCDDELIILELLENCLKLKRVCIWFLGSRHTVLISQALEFLKNQHEQGHRSNCVEFVLKRRFRRTDVRKKQDYYSYPDIIKVTDEVIAYQDYELQHDEAFKTSALF